MKKDLEQQIYFEDMEIGDKVVSGRGASFCLSLTRLLYNIIAQLLCQQFFKKN